MKEHSLHATCVEIQGKAILITGKSGRGKSSLALQLIDRGALLVSDDQTLMTLKKGTLMAFPPPSLKGLMEVRGVGICSFPYQEKSPVKLHVDIGEKKTVERFPESTFREYFGIKIPYLRLIKNDPLGAIKVELKIALKEINGEYA